MALALALSNSGKLQNIELVARDGASMFFSEPADRMQLHHGRDSNSYLLSPNARVGKVAIGVQKLNEILTAYSSGPGARDFSRRSSGEIGKQLFRGAMDLEESLSMLVMLQEASDYMEVPGNRKVLLLEGKENRKSSARSSSSARLVEIADDDDSEPDHGSSGRIISSSNASMQIVAHKKPQSYRPNSNTVLQLSTTVTGNSKSNVSKSEKDDPKVRMPSVIAKLMGLENLPLTKTVADHKGTERFVKPEAVARKETRANVMVGKLPIRIVASERVPGIEQHSNLPGKEWKIGLTNSEESESANSLSNDSFFSTTEKQTRQTMRQVLSKVQIKERRDGEIQGVNVKIIHEDKKLPEESKLQKAVSVGCRTDTGRKMDFLKRFRKKSENKPAIEDKTTNQEKGSIVGKKQATSMKQLLGRGSDEKSRRTREKFNKENLVTDEIKTARKNGMTDLMRRQAHSNQIDKQSMAKKVQNYREMQSETIIQNLEDKKSLKFLELNKSLKLEAIPMENKLACTEVILPDNDKHKTDVRVSKPTDTTHGGHGISEQSTSESKDSSSTVVASSDQPVQHITEEISDTAIAIVQTSASGDSKVFDQSMTDDINDEIIKHTADENTQLLEICTRGEQHQHQQQQMILKEQPMDGSDHTPRSSSPAGLQDHQIRVVSCDSFTENQLLLMTLLLKDQYFLETAMAIVRVQVPVNFINASDGKWSYYKGSDLLSDVGREVIRRKGKRTEGMVEVSMACTANLKLQYLDDLIRELDDDIDSLDISKKLGKQGDGSTAENLKMILQADIQNNHPDANSMWDFGWNRMSDLPVEKNEVVKDLEKNILGGIITDVARELIEVSIRHGCLACEA